MNFDGKKWWMMASAAFAARIAIIFAAVPARVVADGLRPEQCEGS